MKFKEYSQHQLEMFPMQIYEEIPEDDICFFIDTIVNELDIQELENMYSEEGNVAYHPRMMLKILFYSYHNGIFSSRKIAKALKNDIRFWYLSARQKPDFRTIANFRKRHIEQLKDIFKQIVQICISVGIVDKRKVAIDGTKIKANANKDKFHSKEWLEQKEKEEFEAIEKAFAEMDEIDKKEDMMYGSNREGDEVSADVISISKNIKKIRELIKEANEKGKKKINETDRDCSLMKTRHGFQPAYNCQTVIDTESQIILQVDVIDNSNDDGQIKFNIKELIKDTGLKPKILLADAGYFNGEDIQFLAKEKIIGLIADKPMSKIKKSRDGIVDEDQRFKKEQFKYDSDKDVYICPEGRLLYRVNQNAKIRQQKSGHKVEYVEYRCRECNSCPHRESCCKSKRGRKITRYGDEELRDNMRRLIRSDWGYNEYKVRMYTIEPSFGNIKYNIGFREFMLRGLKNVKGEYNLVAIVHNLGKMHKKMKNDPQKRGAFLGKKNLNHNFDVVFSLFGLYRSFFHHFRLASQKLSLSC